MAEALNQRKRYDVALSLFDDDDTDDRTEELLAQKNSNTPKTKKGLDNVRAVGQSSTTNNNKSSANPRAADFTTWSRNI